MDFAIIQLVNYLRISNLQKNFHTLEGKWHYYSINTDIMKEFCGFIKTLCNETTGKCCKGEP